jgi:hypothetical protein
MVVVMVVVMAMAMFIVVAVMAATFYTIVRYMNRDKILKIR